MSFEDEIVVYVSTWGKVTKVINDQTSNKLYPEKLLSEHIINEINIKIFI